MSKSLAQFYPAIAAGIVAAAIFIGFSLTPTAQATTVEVSTIEVVDTMSIGGTTVYKVYDNNNKAVCYVAHYNWSNANIAISCLK